MASRSNGYSEERQPDKMRSGFIEIWNSQWYFFFLFNSTDFFQANSLQINYNRVKFLHLLPFRLVVIHFLAAHTDVIKGSGKSKSDPSITSSDINVHNHPAVTQEETFKQTSRVFTTTKHERSGVIVPSYSLLL